MRTFLMIWWMWMHANGIDTLTATVPDHAAWLPVLNEDQRASGRDICVVIPGAQVIIVGEIDEETWLCLYDDPNEEPGVRRTGTPCWDSTYVPVPKAVFDIWSTDATQAHHYLDEHSPGHLNITRGRSRPTNR